MIVFDDTQPWARKLALYRDYMTWQDGAVPVPNQQAAEWVVVPESEPLRAECQHFCDCCRSRQRPRTDGEEGLRVLRVLQAATVSLRADGEAVRPQALSSQPGGVQVHPTAVIDPGCEIGLGTRIWHFSHVMAGARIGEGCSLGQNVVVSPGVVLGRNVKVQNNVSLYSGVICDDDVFLGPSMVFTNIPNPRAAIVRRDQYQQTLVGRGASIGANATILCGHVIGEYAFIGAGAVVTRDVKPYALMVGNPARQIGWMSEEGHRLDLAVDAAEGALGRCGETGRAYRMVAGRPQPVDDADA
jgi:UDP-2-acetamido-3-amino-2,3-dideoxy-glucuronate N-acetyltransferase